MDEVAVAESVATLLAVSCAHFLRVKKLASLSGGALDLLHNKFAQLNIIPGAIEQVVVFQLACEHHRIMDHLRALNLHRTTEQEAFF